MDNTFAIKNTLIKQFETGNIIYDLILGTLICSLLTSYVITFVLSVNYDMENKFSSHPRRQIKLILSPLISHIYYTYILSIK